MAANSDVDVFELPLTACSSSTWTATIGTYAGPVLQQAGFGANPACATSSNSFAQRCEQPRRFPPPATWPK